MTSRHDAAEKDRPRRAADRIRDTALELFYREGIRAVGVEEIVQTAGVTKPSLYRAFASKEALACAYLQDYDAIFWGRFEAAVAAHPDDPRAAILRFLRRLSERTELEDYRGCGLSNAALEHPDSTHPARALVRETKERLRERLRAMAAAAGAAEPERTGDGLLLLIEGAYATGQIFGPGGPATNLVAVAELLLGPARA
ncbi:TetR/AcrR family transcriptional regulator [Roseomonas elaeocarpi]|uniref:TetR/AcrR family transcriptional regulator n=1 Tax=Roseomonas elaeocarpi TaxID=907779 RepID=A0ABV6JQX3_9PROT